MNTTNSIAKVFNFEAAHRLPGEIYGKCNRMHGHSYKLVVYVKGSVKKDGMVINFSEVSKVVKEQIIEKFDHQLLNDFIELPTAENIIQHFLDILEFYPFKGAVISKLELWETPNSFAILEC